MWFHLMSKPFVRISFNALFIFCTLHKEKWIYAVNMMNRYMFEYCEMWKFFSKSRFPRIHHHESSPPSIAIMDNESPARSKKTYNKYV